MKKLRVALVGAAGRMGQAIISVADSENAEITARIDRDDEIASANGDVIVDFSAPSSASAICELAISKKVPLVVGTTGHSAAERKAIDDAAKKIAVVLASNFSIGVNALFWLTEKAAEILGDGFDLEIVEAHHRLKKDAPSGTAKTLAEILQRTRGGKVQLGRAGIVGQRATDEIGIHSIRGGDIVGEHTVIFAANGERVELTHRAASRETFARGALCAAHWLMGKPPGLYDMRDVLGLK